MSTYFEDVMARGQELLDTVRCEAATGWQRVSSGELSAHGGVAREKRTQKYSVLIVEFEQGGQRGYMGTVSSISFGVVAIPPALAEELFKASTESLLNDQHDEK